MEAGNDSNKIKEEQKALEKPVNSSIEVKNELLSMSEISLWLDTYDDLFSDFDPRPYSKRAMSIDFLDEVKRASREKATGQIELKFLIPEKVRSIDEESKIKRRLHDHFKKQEDQLCIDIKKAVKGGVIMASIGFFLLSLAVIVELYLQSKLFSAIMLTLFEPSGWVMIFYGFDQVFYGSKAKKQELEFYSKMSKADISFMAY